MAARKPGKVAAPVKQKQRKNHGPKKHLFKEFKPMIKVFADSGLLNKYYNYESFCLSCGSKGIRNNTQDLWFEFKDLSYPEKKAYFANIQANAQAIANKDKNKKFKKR